MTVCNQVCDGWNQRAGVELPTEAGKEVRDIPTEPVNMFNRLENVISGSSID